MADLFHSEAQAILDRMRRRAYSQACQPGVTSAVETYVTDSGTLTVSASWKHGELDTSTILAFEPVTYERALNAIAGRVARVCEGSV